jgi:serine/threonine-protein kinase RsbW
MTEGLTISLRNALDELERVAGLVEAFCTARGVPAKTIFQLNLALDEVLTNVISYGYPEGGAHTITVHVGYEPERLVVAVEDSGRAFDPLTVPAPDLSRALDERAVGGLGVHLVRSVMDELEYHRQDGKNLLIMRKRLMAPD